MNATSRNLEWHDFFLEIHERIRGDIDAVKELATRALAGEPREDPGERRRQLSAGGSLWRLQVDSLQVCGFIGAHHQGEDAKLWPALLNLRPELAAEVEAFRSDHARIVPKLDALAMSARDLGQGDDDRKSTRNLIDALVEIERIQIPTMSREEECVGMVLAEI